MKLSPILALCAAGIVAIPAAAQYTAAPSASNPAQREAAIAQACMDLENLYNQEHNVSPAAASTPNLQISAMIKKESTLQRLLSIAFSFRCNMSAFVQIEASTVNGDFAASQAAVSSRVK